MPGGILPPIEVIVNWPTPNYVNPQTRGWGLIALAVTLSTMSLLVVCARLWARIRLHSTGIDDWIILVTMVFDRCCKMQPVENFN
jgi:hypothetical protein